MALADTRNFAGSRFNVSAAPFRTSYDYSVFDHLKYIAISTQAFAVPTAGAVEVSSTIKASTPGTQPGRVIHGTYTATGAPYAQRTLEGQQVGAVMNVIDFATGQLFDWFVSGSTAFALIERLPSNVTGNTSDTSSPDYVGREKMYLQIVREVPVTPGVAHRVSIRFSRNAAGSSVDYFLDGTLVAHVDRVGVPLDVQGQPYTGIYPALGAGEDLGQKINYLVIGHGLFSLLDAFPFQHPRPRNSASPSRSGARLRPGHYRQLRRLQSENHHRQVAGAPGRSAARNVRIYRGVCGASDCAAGCASEPGCRWRVLPGYVLDRVRRLGWSGQAPRVSTSRSSDGALVVGLDSPQPGLS